MSDTGIAAPKDSFGPTTELWYEYGSAWTTVGHEGLVIWGNAADVGDGAEADDLDWG